MQHLYKRSIEEISPLFSSQLHDQNLTNMICACYLGFNLGDAGAPVNFDDDWL